MKKTQIAIVIAAAALLIGGWSSIPRGSAVPTKWEYKTVQLTTLVPTDAEYVKQLAQDEEAMKIALDSEKKNRAEYEAKMKSLGAEGWELVSVVNTTNPMFEFVNANTQEAFFKRPLP
jgi:hypothetical protein